MERLSYWIAVLYIATATAIFLWTSAVGILIMIHIEALDLGALVMQVPLFILFATAWSMWRLLRS